MSRRTLRGGLLLLAAGLLAGPAASSTAGAAEQPLGLEWEQLVPAGEGGQGAAPEPTPRGVVAHGQVAPAPEIVVGEDPGAALVKDYDGKRVRIPGFVVPLDFEATSVRQFLLVPYVGACVHVPPPPPNQIILVDSAEALPVDGLFEPVWVTGTMAAGQLSTEVADVGYKIAADTVVPYEEP